jgi:hypothetical protein
MSRSGDRRCASARRVEANHLGGRNHIAWITCPLCGEHHDRFHALLRQAGVELQYTPDPVERGIRVLKAILIFAWMVVEALHHAIIHRGKAQHDRDA